MEKAPSADEVSLFRYQMLHGLLWFGLPMIAWSTYDWWRGKEIGLFGSTGSRVGDLIVAIAGDLLEAAVFGLIFFAAVEALRQGRLRNQIHE